MVFLAATPVPVLHHCCMSSPSGFLGGCSHVEYSNGHLFIYIFFIICLDQKSKMVWISLTRLVEGMNVGTLTFFHHFPCLAICLEFLPGRVEYVAVLRKIAGNPYATIGNPCSPLEFGEVMWGCVSLVGKFIDLSMDCGDLKSKTISGSSRIPYTKSCVEKRSSFPAT